MPRLQTVCDGHEKDVEDGPKRVSLKGGRQDNRLQKRNDFYFKNNNNPRNNEIIGRNKRESTHLTVQTDAWDECVKDPAATTTTL